MHAKHVIGSESISACCAVIVLVVAFFFLDDEVALLQNSTLEAATYTGCAAKLFKTSNRHSGGRRNRSQYATIAISESGIKATGPYLHLSRERCEKRTFRETSIFVDSLDTRNSRINSFVDFWLLPFVLGILFMVFALGALKRTAFGKRLRFVPHVLYVGGAVSALGIYWVDYERAPIFIAAADGNEQFSSAHYSSDFLDRCIRNTMREGGYRHEREIQRLSCQKMSISSLARLEGLENLEQLYLQGNKLDNLDTMPLLPNLKVLSIASNNSTSVSGIESAPALRELQSNLNKVASIEELDTLEELQTVAFMRNNISDLSPLATLQNLKSVNFSSNNISDLSALSNKPTLAEVHMFGNAITDISPLYENNGLENLAIVGRSNTIQCDQVQRFLSRVSFKIHESWREYYH